MDVYSQWQQFDFAVAGVVFVAYMVTDALYAYYTLAITRKQPIVAASVGSGMHFLIAFGVLQYVQNYLYIVPLAIGSWIGTYVVVRFFHAT